MRWSLTMICTGSFCSSSTAAAPLDAVTTSYSLRKSMRSAFRIRSSSSTKRTRVFGPAVAAGFWGSGALGAMSFAFCASDASGGAALGRGVRDFSAPAHASFAMAAFGTPSGAPMDSCRPRRRPSENSRAEWKRSAGSLESARWITQSSCHAIFVTIVDGSEGRSCITRWVTSSRLPLKGGWRVTSV
jgi:hypothetical protein